MKKPPGQTGGLFCKVVSPVPRFARVATGRMVCQRKIAPLSFPASTTSTTSLPLSIDAVVKRFGQVNAVDGITLELRSGECLGLLGPNGAGKSTLIRSIVGRVIPDAGTILIFGAKADSTAARSTLGWVPQELA